MKKYLITQLIIILSVFAYAQDMVIKGTQHIAKKYTPQQVVDALEKKFPTAKSVKYYKADTAATREGWAVTTEDNLDPGAGVEYYTISFKQDGLQYYGLYDHDGTLLESKVEETMTELPPNVVTSLKSLAADYPGYKVVSKNYYKTQNHSKSKEYYEVTAKKGNDEKKFIYSADGELLKVKG